MKHLNHFILWCKGWYISITPRDVFKDVMEILKLDDYCYVQNKYDVLNILLNYIDDLKEYGCVKNLNFLKMSVWNAEIHKQLILYKCDYELALLYVIRDFFRFHISKEDIILDCPAYSRKLYKMGFISPKDMGNSYKLANYKAKQFFKR